MNITFNPALTFKMTRQLMKSTTDVSQALERLTTGKRIIEVRDDLGSLSSLQKLESHSRGMRQALQNVESAQSLSREATEGLEGLLDKAYELRELAQQAADGNLTAEERESYDDQARSLILDMQSIAEETSYNGISLLNGTFGSMQLQVGSENNQTIDFNLGDARTTSLGRLSIISGSAAAISAEPNQGNSVTVNGVAINFAGDDEWSTSRASYSAIAAANAVNAVSDDSNVFAEALSNSVTLRTDFAGAGSFTGSLSSGEFKINGVNITGTITDADDLVTEINEHSETTGVVASLSGTTVTLLAEDGRNIQLQVSNGTNHHFYDVIDMTTNNDLFSDVAALSDGSDQTHIGAIRLWSSDEIIVAGTNPSLAIGLSSGIYDHSDRKAVEFVDLTTEESAEEALKILDATIVGISTLSANVGALHDRLGFTATNLLRSIESANDAERALNGVDVASEAAKLVTAQILQQTSMSALSQGNVEAAMVSELLRKL